MRAEHRAANAVICVVLVGIVVANLISLDVLQGRVAGQLNRVTRIANLHQGWTMFAPPPEISPTLEAELRYPGGGTHDWQRPGRTWGQYRAYHWGKVEEAIVLRRHVELREQFREWLQRSQRDARGRRPTEVDLREHWRLLRPPGPGPSIAHEHVHELGRGAGDDDRPLDPGKTI